LDIKIELKHLLAEKRFVFGLLGEFFVYFGLQFIMPVMALRFVNLGAEPDEIGVLFAIPTLIYVLHMPFISLYKRLVSKRAVIMFGFALLALSMLLIGNSTWLMIPESVAFTMVGLAILGISFSSIQVPIFAEMLEGLEKRNPEYAQSSELNDMAAGLFNVSMGVAETLAPVLSGFLNQHIGF
jgi:MFS family permease